MILSVSICKHFEKETDIEQTGPDNQPVSIHLSLIRLMLETGRMHQIRIHLSKNGCPIAGDDQHGNFKLNKQLKKLAGIKRLQLSAVRLTIPLEGKDKTFEVSAPFDFKFEE